MLFGFNLNHLFLFPFQDSEARKQFLIGSLICLAGLFIPILPWLIVMGYGAILIRQVLNGEKPHLVPWENWGGLLKDGARLFGIRFIYASPLLILMIPLLAFPMFPVLLQNIQGESAGMISFIFFLVMMAIILVTMPLSLAIGLIVPAAEIHMIVKDDFMAGLRPREWWPVFRKNWGGFVVALAIIYAITMVMTFVMQFMLITIVLVCLLPFFLPAISMYYTSIQYVAFTQAYKEGETKVKISSESFHGIESTI